MIYIKTENVVKQYANHLALNSVSIEVPKGSVFGLLGPNGAGKTTLIRIITRITAPDSGNILIDGKPSTKEDIYKIGYLPEERGLYKKMKVDEHILFLAQLKGMDKSEATIEMNKWLKIMKLEQWSNKKVEELSKGMQQKVQFISTVIHRPDLFIFDEPFSGFDPVNAKLLQDEILKLKAEGRTIILSTHNMESVESLCDNIALINKSKVVLQGNVLDIKKQFRQHIFKIVVDGNDFPFEHKGLTIISKKELGGFCEVRIKKESDISNNELLSIISKDREIISFEEELPSMQDIFINTVNETHTS